MTTITTSNSLAELAARIRAEHEATILAMKRSLDHAVAAGRLLIEAKERLKHGQWLPWLRDHCGVPGRSAQRYMHLAAYAAQGKSARLADLASATDAAMEPEASTDLIHRALQQVFEQQCDSDVEAWLDQLHRRGPLPFCSDDFYDHDGCLHRDLSGMRHDFHQLRIMDVADVPWMVWWCFMIWSLVGDDLPVLRLCPCDDLVAAIKSLAPIASRTRKLPFDSESFATMCAMQNAIVWIQILAARMCARILDEMHYRGMIADLKPHRDPISEEQYWKEFDETHGHVMACLDAKLAELEEADTS